MPIFGLIWLAARRLRTRMGLTLLSLVGVILTVGMVAGIPMFTQAVSFVMLREELAVLAQKAQRPPFAVRFYFVPSPAQPFSLARVRDMENMLARVVTDKVGLPIKQVITRTDTPALTMRSALGDQRVSAQNSADLKHVTISALPLIATHMIVDEGEPYGEAKRDNRIGVWVHQELANQMGLHVGDAFDLLYQASNGAIPVYIAGIWHARDRQDPYWYEDPATSMRDVFLVTPSIYETALQPLFPEQTAFDVWYIILDEQALAIDRADASAGGLRLAVNVMGTSLPGMRMDYSPVEPLQHYLQRKSTLSALMVGFSLPAIALLFYFLSLISTATAFFQREETADLSSRGAGAFFILGVMAVDTLLLIAAGTPLGLIVGYALARLMGYTLSFLTFISRQALPVSLAGLDWRLLGAALLVLLMARLIPVWRASRESVVTYLRGRSRPMSGSILGKIAVDLPLTVASIYAYLHLRQRGTVGIISWDPSGDPFRDPLLLLAPSLFMFTACLLLAHLFPLLIRPLESLSTRLHTFSGYMGLQQLVRQSVQYTSALFLVFICLSLGTFYSSMALSLDQWLYDRIYYQVGADLTVEQGVPLAVPSGTPDSAGPAQGSETEGGWLLPVSDYLEIPGVRAATRVGDFEALAKQSKLAKGRFLGVDRLDFPRVAFFRDDFAPVPLGELMNRLGMYSNGVLVSRQFLAQNGLLEGQRLDMDVRVGSVTQSVGFIIVGSFDYFPTMYPKNGQVFVGNLEYLFEQLGGVFRHHIWMQTDPAIDPALILQRVAAMGVEVRSSADTRLMIAQDEDRVERVGLFGVLSVSFLAGSVLSGLGLLVYTYASLQGRLEQLSILRAIGAQLAQVLATVGIEYVSIIAFGVIGGASIGIISSRLFVPFFQFGSDPALALPPFLAQIAWSKIAWIAVTFAITLILSQLIILRQLSRKDVFMVLRMGQRE